MEKFKYQIYFILILIVVGVVIGGSFLGANYWDSYKAKRAEDIIISNLANNEQPVSDFVKECSDSDTGKNYETFGTVSFRAYLPGSEDSFPVKEYSDNCIVVTDQYNVVSTVAREYYCNSEQQVIYTDNICLVGCFEGSCLTEEIIDVEGRGIFNEKITPSYFNISEYTEVIFTAEVGSPIGLKSVVLEQVNEDGSLIKKIGDFVVSFGPSSKNASYSFDWGRFSATPAEFFFKVKVVYSDMQVIESDIISLDIVDMVLNQETREAENYAQNVESIYRAFRQELTVEEAKESIRDFLRENNVVTAVIIDYSSISFKYNKIPITISL